MANRPPNPYRSAVVFTDARTGLQERRLVIRCRGCGEKCVTSPLSLLDRTRRCILCRAAPNAGVVPHSAL